MNESEDYNEKDNYGRFVITRVNNGWTLETSEYKAVFQDEEGLHNPDSESLSRLISETFCVDYGRWKRQGGFTIDFKDKGYEQEEMES